MENTEIFESKVKAIKGEIETGKMDLTPISKILNKRLPIKTKVLTRIKNYLGGK